jgi:hypothetical protein
VPVPPNRQGNDAELPWAGVLDPATGVTTITPNPNRRNPKALITSDGRVLLVAGATIDAPWADVYP